MNKLFTLILSGFIINFSALAQSLPNAGFENWTAGSGYDNPNNWNTLNSSTSFLGIATVSKSTDAHGGTYSLRGETKFIGAPFNQPAPALVTTGTINVTTQAIEGGIATSERPDSITGWMKYAPVNTDTGYIEVLLYANNYQDTIGRAKYYTPVALSSWTYFSAAIEYYSTNAVEASRVILLPSSGYQPVVGSVVQFDDLAFVTSTGIDENTNYAFNVYPNPATDELFVKNPYSQTLTMKIYDVTGKKVSELNIGINTTRTNISTYSPGVYLYTLTGNNSEILHTGKFAVTR
ncbi:MAG: hypothetical protein POELPBGB_02705 [Bacteroidia bacterium]|nr:hypothetical protein [Bacteroidia bacterium]